jgi:hypothetical protein
VVAGTLAGSIPSIDADGNHVHSFTLKASELGSPLSRSRRFACRHYYHCAGDLSIEHDRRYSGG